MEGGLVTTDDAELYHILLSLRAHGWTRELPNKNYIQDRIQDDFMDLYRFVLPGYNLRPLEMSGALGSSQLRKLPGFMAMRRQNAAIFRQAFAGLEEILLQHPVEESSWFAFSLILRGGLEGRRANVVRALHEKGIECRPIVAGNFVRNPVMKYFEYSEAGSLLQADYIHSNGLYLGNHHVDLESEIYSAANVFKEILSEVTI